MFPVLPCSSVVFRWSSWKDRFSRSCTGSGWRTESGCSSEPAASPSKTRIQTRSSTSSAPTPMSSMSNFLISSFWRLLQCREHLISWLLIFFQILMLKNFGNSKYLAEHEFPVSVETFFDGRISVSPMTQFDWVKIYYVHTIQQVNVSCVLMDLHLFLVEAWTKLH